MFRLRCWVISVISGNISAGKTTLCERLSRTLPDCIYKEESFKKIDGLAEYYAETERNKDQTYNKYALPLQLEFLRLRLENELSCNQAQCKYLVLDRCIYEDYYIFAQTQRHLGFITESEFKEYEEVYEEYTKKVTEPDLFIYLRTSTPKLLERIWMRGREYEQSITPEYLDTLTNFYEKFIGEIDKTFRRSKSAVIDTTHIDQERVFQLAMKNISGLNINS